MRTSSFVTEDRRLVLMGDGGGARNSKGVAAARSGDIITMDIEKKTGEMEEEGFWFSNKVEGNEEIKGEKGKGEEVMMGCHEIEEHGGNHTGLESFLMGLLCFFLF